MVEGIKIVEVQIEKLKPAEYNPRQMTEKQVLDLDKSIDRFGFVEPIVVNRHKGRKNIVVGGHQRLKIASARGMTTVPVVYVDLDEKSERELNLRLNKNNGEWDWDALAEFDRELLLDTGFDDKELNKYFQLDTVEDEAPEPRPDPNVKLGDLFQLGNHRLLCGDATKKEDVERLMDGQKADMVFTDPPYNISYEGGSKKREMIKNDELTDFYEFLLRVYSSFALSMKLGAAIYVCHADTERVNFTKAFRDAGFYLSSVIIWVKNNSTFGRADYFWKHEPILYGWREGGAHTWHGDTKQDTIWNVDRPSRSESHPTMKPIALVEKALINSSKLEDIVLDLFGGSGSTLIACEQLNRKCMMMEIDPQYVRVIIDRWEKLTGKKAVKV